MDFPQIPARQSREIVLPMQTIAASEKEYFLKLEAITRQDAPMIPAGHIAAMEQWQLPVEQIAQNIEPIDGSLRSERTPESISLSGTNFRISFSTADGEMTALEYNGKNLIKEGLQANFWRGLTDNDVANGTPERCRIWKEAGKDAKLKDLKLNERSDKRQAIVTATYRMEKQDADLNINYIIRPDGAVKVTMSFIPGQKQLPEMPRLGMRMILPADYEMMTWLGRGPHENYADRKNSAAIGVYTASVWEQYHPYVRAQETANKCDVRWVALRNQSGEGLLVTGEEPLSISAWNFPLEDIGYRPFSVERHHGGSIEKQDLVWLNIDHMQMGVGGDNTWGAQVHPEYTITPHAWQYSFTIQPLDKEMDAASQAHKRFF